MADFATVTAALDKLAADTAAEKQQVADAQAALSAQIAQLTDQITQLKSAGGAGPADLDAALAQVQSIDAAVQAIQP